MLLTNKKNQWVFLGTYDYWAGYGKKIMARMEYL
ncbi:S6 family peptidase [Neisseria gonorrhoeae]